MPAQPEHMAMHAEGVGVAGSAGATEGREAPPAIDAGAELEPLHHDGRRRQAPAMAGRRVALAQMRLLRMIGPDQQLPRGHWLAQLRRWPPHGGVTGLCEGCEGQRGFRRTLASRIPVIYHHLVYLL